MFALGKSASRLQNAILQSSLTRQVAGSLLSAETLNEIEEAFIQADIGYQSTKEIIAKLAKRKFNKPESLDELQKYLRELITQKLIACQTNTEKITTSEGVLVIILLGLNGAGKTSTAGKLAARLHKPNSKTILVACDTFRAAAREQLIAWGHSANAEMITAKQQSDPAALAFRALALAREYKNATLIIDTAGRLDSDANLMQQLAKIARALDKQKNTKPEKKQIAKIIKLEWWLVLDATIGQTMKNQVKRFAQQVNLSGLIITKLDSSARAGALLAVTQEAKLPIHFVANGEKINDLLPFDAKVFADELIQINTIATKSV